MIENEQEYAEALALYELLKEDEQTSLRRKIKILLAEAISEYENKLWK